MKNSSESSGEWIQLSFLSKEVMEKQDSSTAVEIVIILKGDDQSFRKKFLIYESIVMSHTDHIIKELIEECKKECKFEIEDIRIKASF